MNCNYKVKITDIQNKYQFKILCKGGANSTNVNDIYNLLPTTTNEDTIISISNTADIKAKSIAIKGNTTQDGTPTPTSPVDVKVVTGTNVIKVENENLFANIDTQTLNGMTITRKENGYILNGTTSANTTFRGTIIYPVKSNKTLAVRCDTAITNANIQIKTKNASAGQLRSISLSTANIWETSSGNYEDAYCDIYVKSGVTLNNVLVQPMLISGNVTPTEYVSHKEKDFIINFGNLEFCKIGNYADYLYKENNKWYKYGAIKKLILNGTENWTLENSGQATFRYNINNFYYGTTMDNTNSYCNRFPVKTITNSTTDYGIYGSGTGHYFRIRTETEMTVDNFKSWLSSNNVILYHIPETPTITEITDATLIRQLNNISNNIRTFEGVTNISSSSAGANPIINITTFSKLS